MSIAQIATNVSAMQALNSLDSVNTRLSTQENELATGEKINSAADNPADWQIGTTLGATASGLTQALSNVSEGQSLLGIAQGGQQAILSVLETMQTETTEAANGTQGSAQLQAIQQELTDQANEIDTIVGQTTYNGTSLLDGSFTASLQVGSATTDTMSVSITQNHSAASLGVGSLDVSTGASAALAAVQAAINSVNVSMGAVGSSSTRLGFESNLLSSMITNTDAAKSSIMDADVAQVQMQVSQLQILQQTSISALTQANSAPQALLKLFQ